MKFFGPNSFVKYRFRVGLSLLYSIPSFSRMYWFSLKLIGVSIDSLNIELIQNETEYQNIVSAILQYFCNL